MTIMVSVFTKKILRSDIWMRIRKTYKYYIYFTLEKLKKYSTV